MIERTGGAMSAFREPAEEADVTHDRPLAVAIVDDHPIVRKGLAQVIGDEPDMTVCCEIGTAAETLEAVDDKRPDVAIVDLTLGISNGLQLVRNLLAAHREVRVLVLSMHDELLYAERALAAGAAGYVMKRAPMAELLTAIRRVASGRTYVSERVSERMVSRISGKRFAETFASPLERLTDREREVFGEIGRGIGTRAIARHLEVSVRTVESYKARIKQKLGLKSGSELVRFAVTWAESL